MALQRQAISINLAAGLDTKTDSKHVVPGKLTTLENGVYRKGMAIEKRKGHDELNNVDLSRNALGIGSGLDKFNDELLQFNNQVLYGYSEGSDAWVNKGSALTAIIQSKQIVKNTASQTQCDSAVLNGIGVYAWEDSRGGVRASVIDEASGSVLLADVVIDASGARVKCLAFDQYIYVFYFISTQINAARINPLEPIAFDTGVTVASPIDGTFPIYDVYNYQDERMLIVANGGSTTIKSFWVDENLSQLGGIFAPQTISGDQATGCLTVIEGNGSNLFLAYGNASGSGGIRISIHDLAFRVTTSGNSFDISAGNDPENVTGVYVNDTVGIRIFYQFAGSTPDETLVRTLDFLNPITVSGPSDFARSVGLWSKAFSYTDANSVTSICVGVTHESTLQSSYFVIRSDGLIIGKQQYTNGGGLTARPLLATVNQNGAVFSYAILKKNRIVSENATIFTPTGVMRTSIDFTNSNLFIAKQLGNNLLVVGGVLNMYDGQSLVEHGFLLYPENVSVAAVGSGGSLAAGDYQVFIVYEWTDNFGQIHRSRPSVAETVTVVINGSITVTAPTLRLTRKDGTNRSNISIVGYVTEANGTIAYRFTSISSPIFNDVTVDSVSLGTITSVSTSNEIIYTTGSVLANDPAPACGVIEVFQNRAWLGNLEEASQIVFSKENKTGAPVEFSDEFTKAVPSAGGRVSSLSFVDDKLLALKPDKFFITYGDGPNDTNTLGGFAELEDISVDVGCENPRSITKLPNGIIMKTKKGFYAIDSTLNPVYIGADVEEYNSQTVTSANLIPDLNEVRFTTSNGLLLTYNYYFSKWNTAPNLKSSSSVVWKNKHVLLKTDGTIFAQNPDSFKDANAGYGMRLESGWISMGSLNSYKRVYELLFMGTYKSKHRIRVKVAYDNDDSWIHSGTYDPTTEFPVEFYGDDSPYGESGTVYGGKPIDYAIRVRLKRQKCSSFKFSFEELIESETTGTHESLVISDLGILVGLKKGAVKKPQNRNMRVS